MWTGTHNETVVAISPVTILVTVRLGLRRPPFTGDSGSSQTDNYVPGFSRKEAILFGVLRKELSLLMVYQALGTMEIMPLLDRVQIATFLVFLTFYVPCVSTFAVMLGTIGWRQAWFSIGLSVAVALLTSGVVRVLLEGSRSLLG